MFPQFWHTQILIAVHLRLRRTKNVYYLLFLSFLILMILYRIGSPHAELWILPLSSFHLIQPISSSTSITKLCVSRLFVSSFLISNDIAFAEGTSLRSLEKSLSKLSIKLFNKLLCFRGPFPMWECFSRISWASLNFFAVFTFSFEASFSLRSRLAFFLSCSLAFISFCFHHLIFLSSLCGFHSSGQSGSLYL